MRSNQFILIARQRPFIAEDLLICFRSGFSCVFISSEIVDEIPQVNLVGNVFVRRRHRMFSLRVSRDISFASESVGVPALNSHHYSLPKFNFFLKLMLPYCYPMLRNVMIGVTFINMFHVKQFSSV